MSPPRSIAGPLLMCTSTKLSHIGSIVPTHDDNSTHVKEHPPHATRQQREDEGGNKRGNSNEIISHSTV